jgi:serine/alanine adding enzyme
MARGDQAPVRPRVAEAHSGAPEVAVFRGSGSEWDDFVNGHPAATLAHRFGWRDVIREVFGHEPVYLAASLSGGTLVGVLPLFLLRSPVFGRRAVSVPLLSDGGPLGSDAVMAILVSEAMALNRRRVGKAMELRARHPIPGGPPPSTRKVSVLLALPTEPDELWTSLKAKVRSQVRRPMKEGMEARFGTAELEPFYHVLARNMRDMGTPVLPRALFERIAGTFGDDVVFGTVYHRGAPVAAGAGFIFRDEFELVWASALREHNRSAPNMLLYWAFMERMIGRGVRTFNFGRCTPGGGTHRFKLQWGGTEVPLPWIIWPTPSGPDDAGPGRAARALSAVWGRLPLAVANRAGPVVARQLPWW